MPVLTAEQHDTITAAAKPLAPDRRHAFIAAVVATLADVSVVGPGVIHRAITANQRSHFDPPRFADALGAPRSRRAR